MEAASLAVSIEESAGKTQLVGAGLWEHDSRNLLERRHDSPAIDFDGNRKFLV